LRFTHRTLQRLAVCFAFGIITGLSEQEYTDPRNETAIQTAKKIAQMLEKGDLPLGLYVAPIPERRGKNLRLSFIGEKNGHSNTIK
jgi:hypothetical protein